MKARLAAAVAGVVMVLGVIFAVVAQANIAARDALYARPAALGPDEIYGGVAYSVAPWSSAFVGGVIAASLGVAALLALGAARAVSRRRARLSA